MERDDRQNKRERVKVFDKDWDFDGKWGDRDNGNFIWGTVLIFVGILFLLNSFGIVSWNVWSYIWQFWPVILIIWGVQIILGKNAFSRFIVGVFALVVIGLIVIFSVTKVNPSYKQKLSPQINNVLNQMDGYQMRGFK